MKTPKLTAQVIKFLECHDFEVVNVSYGNDCTDSVLVDGHIRIMLPNSFVNDPDRELFDSFLVIEEEGCFEEFIGNTDVLLEVLDYLK